MTMVLVAASVLPACKDTSFTSSASSASSASLASSASSSVTKKVTDNVARGARALEQTPPAETSASASVSAEPLEPCPQHNCGSNAAEVNGSPLDAIPLDGRESKKGFAIEPTLHPRPGTAAPALRLEIRDGQIVGLDGSGKVAATGDELKGRWLRLARRPSDGTPAERGKIRIADVAYVRLMARRSLPAGDPDHGKPEVAVGYQLEYEPESNPARATDLCRFKAPLFWPKMAARASETFARAEQAIGREVPASVKQKASSLAGRFKQLVADAKKHVPSMGGLEKLPGRVLGNIRREIALDQLASLIFVIKGETYNEISAKVEDAPGAFTLACPGMALFKMKIMGYDPEDQRFKTTRAQRQAVIKMITGRYCGKFVYTRDRLPVFWQNRSQWFSWSSDGAVEALWNEHGAICLNTPRNRVHTRDAVVHECRHPIPTCDPSVTLTNLPPGAELVSIVPP